MTNVTAKRNNTLCCSRSFKHLRGLSKAHVYFIRWRDGFGFLQLEAQLDFLVRRRRFRNRGNSCAGWRSGSKCAAPCQLLRHCTCFSFASRFRPFAFWFRGSSCGGFFLLLAYALLQFLTQKILFRTRLLRGDCGRCSSRGQWRLADRTRGS